MSNVLSRSKSHKAGATSFALRSDDGHEEPLKITAETTIQTRISRYKPRRSSRQYRSDPDKFGDRRQMMERRTIDAVLSAPEHGMEQPELFYAARNAEGAARPWTGESSTLNTGSTVDDNVTVKDFGRAESSSTVGL
jgi:hypothetical protein